MFYFQYISDLFFLAKYIDIFRLLPIVFGILKKCCYNGYSLLDMLQVKAKHFLITNLLDFAPIELNYYIFIALPACT